MLFKNGFLEDSVIYHSVASVFEKPIFFGHELNICYQFMASGSSRLSMSGLVLEKYLVLLRLSWLSLSWE